MKVLAGNKASSEWVKFCSRYDAGTLISVTRKAISPPNIYYALDNGAYSCFKNGTRFDGNEFLYCLDRWYLRQVRKPDWLVVPDVVGNRKRTISNWYFWVEQLKNLYQIPLAFAVQDGMTNKDVPADAEVIFVGGSTDWKEKTISYWCSLFSRVHVARVNGWRRLWKCFLAGATSVDGSGFLAGGFNSRSMVNIELFLLAQKINLNPQDLIPLSPVKRFLLLKELKGETLDIFQGLPLFDNNLSIKLTSN